MELCRNVREWGIGVHHLLFYAKTIKSFEIHRMRGNCFSPVTAVFIERGEYCCSVSKVNCAEFLKIIIHCRL